MPIGVGWSQSSPAASRAHDGLVDGYPGMCAWTGSSFRMLHVVRYLDPVDIFLHGVVVYMIMYLIFPFEKLGTRHALPR